MCQFLKPEKDLKQWCVAETASRDQHPGTAECHVRAIAHQAISVKSELKRSSDYGVRPEKETGSDQQSAVKAV